MIRQIVIAMVLSVALTLGFLLMMIRSTTGGERLCSVGKAVLQDVSGQVVEIGSCSVDPIGTRVTIRNVRIGPANAPLFRAERLSAGIDHQGFLSGKIRIDHVEIVHPQVALDLSRPRPARAAEIRPPGAACLPDLGRLEMGTAVLIDGEMHVLLPDGRSVDEKGMEAELHGDGEKLAVSFKAASSTYADKDGETTANRAAIRGQFDLNAGTAKLDAVDLSAPEGSIFAEGELASICNLRGNVSATVRADFGALHRHLLRDIENLAGTGTLRAAVAFDGARFDATAEATVRDSTVLRFAPGDFSASFRATPQTLEVTRFDLPLESGRVSASGRLVLAAPYQLTADAKLDNMVLGELLERLGERDLPLQLRASGTATLSGPLVTDDGPALDIALDATVPEFGVYDRSFKRRTERQAQRYIAFKKGAIKGAFRVGSHSVEFSRAHIAASDTDIDLSGSVYFDAAKGLNLRFDSARVRLDELGPFGPAKCEGTGELHGRVSGPYAALDIDASATVRDLRVQGYDIGHVSAHTHLDLGAQLLDVLAIKGERGESKFTGDARLTFREGTTVETRLSLDGAHAVDLIAIAQSRFPALAKLKENVDALVTGDIELSGPTDAFDIDARLAMSDVKLYGQRFDSGIARVTMRRGAELRLRTLELVRDSGRVLANGQLDLEDLAFKLRLVTRGLRMAHVDALGARAAQSSGSLSLRLDMDGTIDEPTINEGTILINDWMLGEQPLATVQLKFGLNPLTDPPEPGPRKLLVDGTISSPWPAEIPRPPHTPGESWPLPPGSMAHSVKGTFDFSGEMPFELAVAINAPDLRVLMTADRRKFTGGLYGELHANGLLTHPSDVFATLDLNRLWLKSNGTKFETDKTAAVTLKEGRLWVRNLDIKSDSFRLSASGAREADGRLDFHAEGALDLAIIKDQFPDFEESAGQLVLDLRLGGTQSDPAFVGQASLEGVALHLRGLPLTMKHGSGAITFGKGAALIERFASELNGGPLTLKGGVTLDSGYLPGACDFQAEMGSIPLVWDDIPMVISGTPEIKRDSANDKYTLKGQMHLDRLRFTQDLDLEKSVARVVEYLRRPPTPTVLAKTKEEVLLFDLPIAMGDVRVDNNLAKASLNGELRLTGTNRHYGVMGAVTVTDAKAYVRSNEFKVSSAVVNFTEPTSIKANFDVRADSMVRNEYLVHVNATGTPSKPEVNFSSEPALSQADIVMLLTIGVTSRDFATAGTGNAFGGVLLDAAYNATGIPEQMKRLLPKNDFLRNPTFHVSSGYNPMTQNTEPLAVLEGKLLRDDWTLQGQTSLLGHAGSTKAALDVKLRKNISASAQWNDDPSAPNSGDFGGDVRFHWEAP